MPRGVPHSPRKRAAAVAELATGARPTDVARKYGVSLSQLRYWRQTAGVGTAYARTREALGDMVYDLVADNIETLRVQARLARSEDWFEKQSAADVAELVGTLSDRTIRLLAAFRPAGPDTALNDGADPDRDAQGRAGG